LSLLTIEKTVIYDSMCMNLLNDKRILYAGIVNDKGRIVTGSFEEFPKCFECHKDFEVFLMEIALEFSMKREFDKNFGKIDSVISKRGLANVICVPIADNVLVIVSHSNVPSQDILKKCTPVFERQVV